MTYQESIDWLFSQLPMFSRTGAAAYKPGLDTSHALDAHFGHPHRKFRSIHVAGTNGKGSTSSMIAAALQAQGYRTALYTSPHLVDFRERMRIGGRMIPKESVVDFVERFRASGYDGHPSFFELTMMMAFDWFAGEKVDYAVIEVGMGGRLDSTNIITPEASVITNISFDHTQFLGATLPAIAAEKAGIIKPGIPVVIGEAQGEIREVFAKKAAEVGAPITFAEDNPELLEARHSSKGGYDCVTRSFGNLFCELSGEYQRKNINTALTSFDMLRKTGIELDEASVRKGMAEVCELTGFRGRWTVLSENPLTICDTGHNQAGLEYNMSQLAELMALRRDATLRMVIGFVADKDIEHILELLPKDARYYFCNARIPRALPAADLAAKAACVGLIGDVYPSVKSACQAARLDASLATQKSHIEGMDDLENTRMEDIIYIGGSTFVVADFLESLEPDSVTAEKSYR